MSATKSPTDCRASGLQGHHVLYAMLAFFGVVFAVNGLMLYRALATHSGLVANEPYRKGLAYNERIVDDERQAALKWSAELTASRHGHVVFVVDDAAGNPVVGLGVTAMLGRPTSNRHDTRFDLVEAAPGRYVAAVGSIEAGTWLADVEVRGSAGASAPLYRLRRRLWLTP